MNKEKIRKYLIEQGYNRVLILQLNTEELYRIFILTLAFNSSITL